uniref:succinate dehydrogenase subunit 4 n=1 Tax=Polysiphonia morrowii TaxID=173542 RepID=UPI002E77D132|nr:succinate dehydrogenase subunit 4 [Polysiphonia morrowii]WQF69612.1 succinate dehydrogenase subunit 4 [Polysiphonia morrowii]
MFFWFFRYFYVLFLLISLLLDFEFHILNFNFITLHFFYGFISILKDYVHQFELKLFLIFLGRLLILVLSSIIIEVIF